MVGKKALLLRNTPAGVLLRNIPGEEEKMIYDAVINSIPDEVSSSSSLPLSLSPSMSLSLSLSLSVSLSLCLSVSHSLFLSLAWALCLLSPNPPARSLSCLNTTCPLPPSKRLPSLQGASLRALSRVARVCVREWLGIITPFIYLNDEADLDRLVANTELSLSHPRSTSGRAQAPRGCPDWGFRTRP